LECTGQLYKRTTYTQFPLHPSGDVIVSPVFAFYHCLIKPEAYNMRYLRAI